MRIGLLADVHANLAALRAALAWLDEQGAERLLVAGDLVGYGAHPNECVELLAEVGARCVAGNHDLFVLDRLPDTRFPELARRSAALTRSQLSGDVRSYLAALPPRLQADGILMTHGSLDSPEEYVVDERRAAELLRRMAVEAPACDTLVLGHTHRQWCVVEGAGVRRVRGTVPLPAAGRLLNPGSVGQSRQRERRPRARCALFDSGAMTAEYAVLDYDVDESLQAVRDLGLPDRCVHAPPRLRGRLLGAARRAARRVGGRRPNRR